MKERNIAVEWLTSIFFGDVMATSKEDHIQLCDMLGDQHVMRGEFTRLTSSKVLSELSEVTVTDTNKSYRSLPETTDLVRLRHELMATHGRLISGNLCIREMFYWMECVVEDNASRHVFIDGKSSSKEMTINISDTLQYRVIPEQGATTVMVKFLDKEKKLMYLLRYEFGHPMKTTVKKYLMPT